MKKLFSVILIFLVASCNYSPILDENKKLLKTPKKIVDKDIADCTTKAEGYLKDRKLEKIGKAALRKGAIGSIFGFGIGILTGGGAKGVAMATALGAGAGAGEGAVSAAGEGKISSDSAKQKYIANCLKSRGYVVLGWD